MIRRHQALSGITGRKETRRRFGKSFVKSCSLTAEPREKLPKLRDLEERGIPGGVVKYVDIRRNTNCEGTFLEIF